MPVIKHLLWKYVGYYLHRWLVRGLWWNRPRWLRYRWWFFRAYDAVGGLRWYRAQRRFPFLSRLRPR